MEELHRLLATDFESTLREEVIPGLLHNFANPLNGIMGRSRLLQKRLQDHSKEREEGIELASPVFGKVVNDVGLIARDSDKLSGMLQVVAEKMYSICNTERQAVNLTNIIDLEVRFLDFYLDFKHNVQRTIDLNRDVPSVMGVPAEFSLSLWGIFRHRMEALRQSPVKDFFVSTGAETGRVRIDIHDSGAPLPGVPAGSAIGGFDPQELFPDPAGSCPRLFRSLALLKRYNAVFQAEVSGGTNRLCISIPVRG
jgi:nitrogen-specific signal transduction histidine kinase